MVEISSNVDTEIYNGTPIICDVVELQMLCEREKEALGPIHRKEVWWRRWGAGLTTPKPLVDRLRIENNTTKV